MTLDKPIIHFQIPLLPPTENGVREDNFAVSFQTLNLFMSFVKSELKDKAYLIATPFSIDLIGAEGESVNLEPTTLEAFLKKMGLDKGEQE